MKAGGCQGANQRKGFSQQIPANLGRTVCQFINYFLAPVQSSQSINQLVSQSMSDSGRQSALRSFTYSFTPSSLKNPLQLWIQHTSDSEIPTQLHLHVQHNSNVATRLTDESVVKTIETINGKNMHERNM